MGTKDPTAATTGVVGITAVTAVAKEEDEGDNTHEPNTSRSEDYDCVTLAITTCKRLHGFLGAVNGLQAS